MARIVKKALSWLPVVLIAIGLMAPNFEPLFAKKLGPLEAQNALSEFDADEAALAWTRLGGTDVGKSTCGASMSCDSRVIQQIDRAYFCTGADGDLTISSGTLTLQRDMCFHNVTINGTGSIALNGWRLFANGKLDLTHAPTGAITASGVSATNAGLSTNSAPVGGQNTHFDAGSQASGAGIGAGAGPGGAGQDAPLVLGFNGWSLGGLSGNGGTGGASDNGNAGGAAGRGTFNTNPSQHLSVLLAMPNCGPLVMPLANGSTGAFLIGGGDSGSGGGAGGGAGGIKTGGRPGSGGEGGKVGTICAWTIDRGPSTAVGAVQSKGGRGGDGGPGHADAGGGGAGSGGGGGFLRIVAGMMLGTPAIGAIDVSPGDGGNGGAPGTGSTPVAGSGGWAGHGGNAQVNVLFPPTATAVTSFNAAPATAPSGQTGGTGAVVRGNL